MSVSEPETGAGDTLQLRLVIFGGRAESDPRLGPGRLAQAGQQITGPLVYAGHYFAIDGAGESDAFDGRSRHGESAGALQDVGRTVPQDGRQRPRVEPISQQVALDRERDGQLQLFAFAKYGNLSA